MTLAQLHAFMDRVNHEDNYDCGEYDKIDALTDALSEVGLMVEDKTGWWSGVYEVSNA